jgi:hypothetical protein
LKEIKVNEQMPSREMTRQELIDLNNSLRVELAQEKKRAEAYREIALRLHKVFDCIGKETMCEPLIDAEAQKLLEGK